MSLLTAEARFHLAGANDVIARVCEHLSEHAATLSRDGDDYAVAFSFGRSVINLAGDRVNIRAEASDMSSLHHVRLALASHIVEYAGGDRPMIIWTGDGADMKAPPNFRLMTVSDVGRITPRMIRIRLSGENLDRFASDDNIHVTLMAPPPGEKSFAQPTLGADGLIAWPGDAPRPASRKYTIRGHDVAAGAVTIDFVDHGDFGPASAWARRARPGDQIGMVGPGGLGARPAAWSLFIGDETALPAIGRILESLPAAAKGRALIEVAAKDEEQKLNVKADLDIRWLHRNGAPAGSTTLLLDAVRAVDFPAANISLFAWAAGEAELIKRLKFHFSADRNLERRQYLAVPYWRRAPREKRL